MSSISRSINSGRQEAFLLLTIDHHRPEPSLTNCLSPFVFHGPGLDQPVGFLMDQEGDCNFATAAGFTEPALFLQTDGLGSLTTLINQTRGFFRSSFLAERTRYDAFGQPTFTPMSFEGQEGSPSNRSAFGHPYAFTGREWDPESGLYYYRARYYDPNLGRFLQEDPAGLRDGLNLYQFAHNNPLRFADPSGTDARRILVITGDGIPHSVLEVDDPSSRTSKRIFDFGPSSRASKVDILAGKDVPGKVRESTIHDPKHFIVGVSEEREQTMEQDARDIDAARKIKDNPPTYNVYRNNCFIFTEPFLD